MASAATIHEPQSAPAVLMVRPARFGFNAQTAASNAFQHGIAAAPGAAGDNEVRNLALREFDALAEALARAGVGVIVADDTAEPVKPDAVFPNNWVSFHLDGTVVLYPMMAPNRRGERREEVLRRVRAGGGFRIARTVDLTHHEQQGKFLEGTGSMVLDRVNRVAYAEPVAADPSGCARRFCPAAGLRAGDLRCLRRRGPGRSITPTCCWRSAADSPQCAAPPSASPGTARPCTRSCAHRATSSSSCCPHRCGRSPATCSSLRRPVRPGRRGGSRCPGRRGAVSIPPQRRTLERHGGIVCVEIPTIERYGGGGVRCMLAEIHLPSRAGRMESASTLLS